MNNIKEFKGYYSICLYDCFGLGKSEKGLVFFIINDNVKCFCVFLFVVNIYLLYYFVGGFYVLYIIIVYNNFYLDEVLGVVFIVFFIFGYFYIMGICWF